MTAFRTNLQLLWQRLSRPDILALALVLVGIGAYFFAPSGGLFGLVKFLGLLGAVYLLVRFVGWWRNRLLWSLRNRLIVAYLFIALVPVLLVILLAVQAGMLLYSQLGGYLLYEDMQKRVQMLDDSAAQIAAALSTVKGNVTPDITESIISAQEHEVYDTRLPGLDISFTNDAKLFDQLAENKGKFAGLLQRGDSLSLVALRAVQTAKGKRFVELSVPVTSEFLANLAPDLGHVLIDLVEPRGSANQKGISFRVGNKEYLAIREIRAKGRTLPPASNWLDREVTGFSRFDALRLSPDGRTALSNPVVGSFSARPSKLNSRMFTSVGDLSYLNFLLFFVLAGVLLVIGAAALITGMVMARRITQAVDDLYNATQYVQQRDFGHRVKIASRDQLGVLGESFNLMTESIDNLIQEQKQRQRLENEISIAREVQNQLFPQTLPSVPGVEIEAICKAARTVSGDYYDFIQLSPTQLAIAIADISGKGISAALLMASLQAALRSQLLTEESKTLSTAELVARLNKHLFYNTGDDRFATFFIAVYDCATRALRYTNAGHLPSFCVCDGTAIHLDQGGIVLGVVDDYPYEQGTIVVPAGAMLIGYSDGLVEPENVYGEEFGIQRLKAAAVSLHNEDPRSVANGLMQAAEEWAGTPEQADDMTVIVARLS
jgi:sigma-B regulation protein RsbU (phosphoserine phosphatase)